MNFRDLLRRIAPPPPAPRPVAAAAPLEVPDIVTVYGADWCADCGRAKRYLDSKGIPYRWVDLQRNPAAQQRVADAGYRAIPIVATPDGRVLIEPSNAELALLLRPGRPEPSDVSAGHVP